MASLSSLEATFSTAVAWTAENNITGGLYNPISNPGTLNKRVALGTADANNTSGGADQFFSFQQAINAGASATLDLSAMMNILAQANTAIVAVKSYQIRHLSADDDPTISPAPNTTSKLLITNMGPAAPNP